MGRLLRRFYGPAEFVAEVEVILGASAPTDLVVKLQSELDKMPMPPTPALMPAPEPVLKRSLSVRAPTDASAEVGKRARLDQT